MIVPKTKDGRVVFMLPWLEQTIAGTTDSSTDITMRPQVQRTGGMEDAALLPCSRVCCDCVVLVTTGCQAGGGRGRRHPRGLPACLFPALLRRDLPMLLYVKFVLDVKSILC